MTFQIPLDNVTVDLVQSLDPIGSTSFEDTFSKVSGDRFDFMVPEIATFSVRAGHRVLIQAHPETSPDILELYLRGTVLAILLFQRGVFCLHASSVVVENKAIVFAGNSGSGKSTSAFLLNKLGYTCLNDDVTPIYFSNTGIETKSLTSEMKVDIDLLEGDLSQYKPVPSQEHKVFYTINSSKENVEIEDLYFFQWGNQFNLSEIRGSEKLHFLLQHVFRNEYLQAFPENQQKFFKEFVRLSESIRMFLVTKTMDQGRDEVIDLMLRHIQKLQ